MSEAARRGDTRRAIFSNFANGVRKAQIMEAFGLSEAEVDREVAFVARKIREYRFRRHLPALPCADERDIRWNRRALLETLGKLGPEYLSSDLLIPNVRIQKIDTNPSTIMEVARRTGARVSG